MSRFGINNNRDLDVKDAVETYEMNVLVDTDDYCFYMIVDCRENVEFLASKLNALAESEAKLVGLKEFMLKKLEVCEEEYDRLCYFGASTSVVLGEIELLEELVGMLK